MSPQSTTTDPSSAPAALDLTGDVVDLTRALIDIESVSGDEAALADAVEGALRSHDHLAVTRIGNGVIARTDTGASERVVIAGHLDTVPIAEVDGVRNVPCLIEGELGDGERDGRRLVGRGACDMKGGVAVALHLAATVAQPVRDVTWIFYDNEEVEEEKNGLGIIAAQRPDLLEGSFAVLGEPTNAQVEGGCQGTMRVRVELRGKAAHSARAWKGHNAIHDLGEVLSRLAAYQPARVMVDGLEYREGLNAVKVGGGIAGNVIPDRGWVEINYRFAPDKDGAAALAHVQEVLDGYELEVTDLAPGARPGLDRPAAAGFMAAVRGQAHPKFGWTDVARFSELGIPAVNFGPGDPSKAHADDEFCPASDIITCRDALRRWLTSGE